MIRTRGIMHLDGSYKRQFREPTVWSSRDGPNWVVTKAGPRYFNVYEVLEHDAEGLAWLEAHEDVDDRFSSAASKSRAQKAPTQGSLEL